MNKKKKIIAVTCTLLLFVILLTAVISIYKNQKIVLTFGMFAGSNWDVANANSYAIIDQAIEVFEKEHPNVQVVYESGVVKDEYSEWLSQKIISGETPDVFMVLTSDFNQFSSIGVMKDLHALMMEDSDFDQEKYYQSALNTGIYLGNQYALPYETVPSLMFVNKTLLNQSGFAVPDEDWTWNDFLTMCETVTSDLDGDGIYDQFGIYNYGWKDAVYSNGAQLFDSEGKETYFTDQRVMDAIKFQKKVNETNDGQKVTQDDFDGGHVAFMPLRFSDYRTYKTYPYKIKKYSTFQWDCITMPAGPYGGNISGVDTLLMGINSETKHEKLSWEFLKLLTYRESMQMDIFQYSQGASVLKDVTESDEAEQIIKQDMEEGEKVIDNHLLSKVLSEGTVAPKFQKYEEAVSLADGEITKILEDDKNVESSMKILKRKIVNFLKK